MSNEDKLKKALAEREALYQKINADLKLLGVKLKELRKVFKQMKKEDKHA